MNHKEALAYAKDLVELGVPVFRAPKMQLPKDWQLTEPNYRWVDLYQPGDGLAAVMGHVYDAVDIDPRNGGDVGLVDSIVHYGLQHTPRGGRHLLIPALGVGKKQSILPGVDLQGGKLDGSSRGFIWIAPTVRYGAAYKWTAPPAQVPDSAYLSDEWAWIAELAQPAEKPAEPSEPVEVSSDPPPATYVARFYAEDLPAYVSAEPGTGDTRLWQLVRRAYEFINAGWVERVDILDAINQARLARIKQHPTGGGQTEEDRERILRSAKTKKAAVRSEGLKVGGKLVDQGKRPAPIEGAPPATAAVEASTGVLPLELEWANEREPEAPRWFWGRRGDQAKGYAPIAGLTLLSGAPGIGKSSIGYDLVASLSRGDLPGEHEGNPMRTLVVATEDHWTQAVLPRLVAARANRALVARVHPDKRDLGGKAGELSLPDDMARLRVTIMKHQIGLVLLDPLMSRLGGKLDTHKDAEVREALEPLKALGEETGVTFLGVIHNRKDVKEVTAQSAVMGSVAFTAVARSVLMAHVDHDDPQQRYMTLAKSNSSPTSPITPALAYRMVEVDAGKDPHDGRVIRTTKIQWEGDRELSATDLLNPVSKRVKAASVVAWAQAQDRVVTRGEMVKYGEAQGISRAAVDEEIRRAVPELLASHGRGLYAGPGVEPRGGAEK